MRLLFFLAAALSITGTGHQSPELSIKDNTIFCGECELVKLTDFEVCYTLPSEDITKGEKEFTTAFADHRPAFEASGNGFYEKETQSTMTLARTGYGLEINVKSPLNIFSEYGVSIPFNFMGKEKRGGWRKQYVINNVFRSTDGKILYAYLTSPSGCNICVAAMNNLAGWKSDFPSYSCHYFEKLCLYANFDRAYGPRERENEVSFQIFPVKDYDDLLGKLSKILDVPFLDVDKTGGKIGSRIKLIPYGKIDSVRIVNDFSRTCKTIPFKNEIEIECESDTYLYPVRCRKGEAVVGGEAEIYGYADIIDTYRKTMDQVSLFRVFHRKNLEFDGNMCEHQCWMSAGLRFLMKYGDRMNADEKRRLTDKLNCLLDVITETDPANAVQRVTILNTPQSKYPAYNVFGDDRIQEEAFGMTILLDAYKYFGDKLYYDYLINTMDSFLSTYQKDDGALRRFNGHDYSTVCCLIIPIIDVANFLADKDKARSERYMESARKLAWHICRRGAVFPTEGATDRDPEDQEMEDGSISCSALSLLYYCDNVEYIPEFITTAKEILDLHETWVMRSSSCGSKCSSLRWWETCWEGDQNGPAFCAGHAWTIWRAEGDWLYYKLTGDEKYYVKAFNGFMTNISKIRPDGKTYAVRNIDMIPGGGFYTDAECTVFRLQDKFPETYDSGLSRYMWIRAHNSILDSLLACPLPAGAQSEDNNGITPVKVEREGLRSLPVLTQSEGRNEIKRIRVASEGLSNPERGFRFEIMIGLEDGDKSYARHNWPFVWYKDDGVVMAQAYCYLTKYFNSDIPQSKLDALQADFDRARKDGVKFVLRFAYQNVMDDAKDTPSLERILSHIKQLTPIVRKNIDVIYVLQTGWLGAWGEFHSDPNGIDQDPEAVLKVLQATLDMLPPNRSTMVRRMAYRDRAEQVAGEGNLDISRIGFFNDGTLANYTDGGTFDRTEEGDSEFDKVTCESADLPVDGELFWGSVPNLIHANALSALDRFIQHHYTTFSIVHSNSELDCECSIDAWKVTPFTAGMLKAHGLPCDDNYFKHNPHPSGYEYIRDHFGYRLEAVRNEGKLEDGVYEGSVTVRNVGFSRPINPRKAYLVLFNENGDTYEYETSVDARTFIPWEEVEVSLSGKLPSDAPKGRYRAALWLPDEEASIHYRPEYAITLAEGTERVVVVGGRVLNVLP